MWCRTASIFVALVAGCHAPSSSSDDDGQSDDVDAAVDVSGAGDAAVDSNGTCPLYQVPSSTDLTTPAVSFTQVVGIFHASCAGGSCHGATSAPAANLYLGADTARIHANLVNTPAKTLSTMMRVTVGDPSHSFLMHKLDADQCAFDHECSGGTCGALMPKGRTTPIAVQTRDTIRRWIAQGAPP